MTGATAVHLLLWSDDRQDWLLPAPGGDTVPVSGTGHERAVPLSVLRYVQRTGEPLVVDDAGGDDRFARDPYFTDADCCSLLAVPILSRGTLRAVLLLENRLIRGAFTTDRLDAVKLIAGQLAVSLDNAQLYAELTASRARIVAAGDEARRRIERDLHDGAQQRLISLALQLRVAQAAAPPGAGELVARLDSLVNEVTGTLDELRELARGIHPVVLAEGGLTAALEVSRPPQRRPGRTRCAGRGPVAGTDRGRRLLRGRRGADECRQARPGLDRDGHRRYRPADRSDLLQVEVHDDGRGGAELALGTGLLGLKDRVEALGGAITVESPRGKGTTLRVTLPITGVWPSYSKPDARPTGRSSRGPRHRCPRLFALAVMRPAAPEDMLTTWRCAASWSTTTPASSSPRGNYSSGKGSRSTPPRPGRKPSDEPVSCSPTWCCWTSASAGRAGSTWRVNFRLPGR